MNMLKAPAQEVHQARADTSIEAFQSYKKTVVDRAEARILETTTERYLAERMVDQADEATLPYAMERARKAHAAVCNAVADYYELKAQERLS